MGLLILTPDNQAPLEFSPSSVRDYPLDSVLIVPPGERQLQLLGDALGAIQQAPYLPLAVGASAEPSGPLRFTLGGDVVDAISVRLDGHAASDGVGIRLAIRARGCPSKAQLVCMVVRAVGGGAAIPLAKALANCRLTRPEQRALVTATGLGPVAWRSLYWCLQLVAETLARPRAVESLARDYEISPKTVWVRCQRFFGLTWMEASAGCAWEALVQRAIERSFTRPFVVFVGRRSE